MLYESSLKAKRDYNNSIVFAEKNAWKKGREEGIEIGMEKGMEKKSYILARNLILQLHLSDEDIAGIAEVPVDFVRKIRKELNNESNT